MQGSLMVILQAKGRKAKQNTVKRQLPKPEKAKNILEMLDVPVSFFPLTALKHLFFMN